MIASELIEKLQKLPPDTVIGVSDSEGEFLFHVSRTALSVVHEPGVAIIDPSPNLLEGLDL